jgi:hypothetical protein
MAPSWTKKPSADPGLRSLHQSVARERAVAPGKQVAETPTPRCIGLCRKRIRGPDAPTLRKSHNTTPDAAALFAPDGRLRWQETIM